VNNGHLTEATWQKYQMAFKEQRTGKNRRAPEPKNNNKIKNPYLYVYFFVSI